ncbi:MAG: hypothetical protein WCJ07_07795 [Verrucomicrobiota bacterium]
MSPQAGWILRDEIAPRIAAVVPRSIQAVGAEDHAELVQDGITMAAKMIDRVEAQGKLGKVTASNIAYYTIQHLKSGRRAGGSSTVDIMATATQLNGSTRLHSLNEVVSESECGDEIFELQDVISQDTEDPSTQAARKIDWDLFMAGLSHVEKLVVEFLSAGKTLREAGRKAGLSDSSMQNYRKKIAVKLLEAMGADILKDIMQIPGWRIGLDCERELMACRADRRN